MIRIVSILAFATLSHSAAYAQDPDEFWDGVGEISQESLSEAEETVLKNDEAERRERIRKWNEREEHWRREREKSAAESRRRYEMHEREREAIRRASERRIWEKTQADIRRSVTQSIESTTPKPVERYVPPLRQARVTDEPTPSRSGSAGTDRPGGAEVRFGNSNVGSRSNATFSSPDWRDSVYWTGQSVVCHFEEYDSHNKEIKITVSYSSVVTWRNSEHDPDSRKLEDDVGDRIKDKLFIEDLGELVDCHPFQAYGDDALDTRSKAERLRDAHVRSLIAKTDSLRTYHENLVYVSSQIAGSRSDNELMELFRNSYTAN